VLPQYLKSSKLVLLSNLRILKYVLPTTLRNMKQLLSRNLKSSKVSTSLKILRLHRALNKVTQSVNQHMYTFVCMCWFTD